MKKSPVIHRTWPIGMVRYVHAQRARKLRRRGENVRPFGVQCFGRHKVVFCWMPRTLDAV